MYFRKKNIEKLNEGNKKKIIEITEDSVFYTLFVNFNKVLQFFLDWNFRQI